MQINQSEGRVIFDNLVSADREMGSNETITLQQPAEKAVATNAKGVFENKSLSDINASAKTAASGLARVLAC